MGLLLTLSRLDALSIVIIFAKCLMLSQCCRRGLCLLQLLLAFGEWSLWVSALISVSDQVLTLSDLLFQFLCQLRATTLIANVSIAVTSIVSGTIHARICSCQGWRIDYLSLAVPDACLLGVQAILNHLVIVAVKLRRCQVGPPCRWSWVLLIVSVPTVKEARSTRYCF